MSWTQPAYETVASLINRRTGLSLANRADSVELGVRRAMARGGFRDLDVYAAQLPGNDSGLEDLVNELTVGETYFFREPAHFRFIQSSVLPDVVRRRGPAHALRAWSAACASGEEPYSLAILFEQAGLSQTHLMASDISQIALAKARKAVYDAWSLRGENAQAAAPYLSPLGKRLQLDEKIRRRVSFAHLNLALDVYPSFASGLWGMDLILCRNVLIYLDAETVRLVSRRLHDTLAEGGWLITASSDPPLWELASFEVVTAEEGLFYRRPAQDEGVAKWSGNKMAARPTSLPTAAPESLPEPVAEPVASGPVDAPPSSAPPADPLWEARQAHERGDYRRTVQLTRDRLDDTAAAILQVRALANLETADAERACVQAVVRHPFCTELRYLHAVLVLHLGRDEEAIQALRRVLYLDRSLAVAHFTLGSILRDRGDRAGALRSFRNARDLCVVRPAVETVPLADGEQAGRLAEITGKELALLEDMGDKS